MKKQEVNKNKKKLKEAMIRKLDNKKEKKNQMITVTIAVHLIMKKIKLEMIMNTKMTMIQNKN